MEQLFMWFDLSKSNIYMIMFDKPLTVYLCVFACQRVCVCVCVCVRSYIHSVFLYVYCSDD